MTYITIDEGDGRPIYRQIVEEIKALIARGELKEEALAQATNLTDVRRNELRAEQRKILQTVIEGGDVSQLPPQAREYLPWFREFLTFDPLAVMRRVRQPVLIRHAPERLQDRGEGRNPDQSGGRSISRTTAGNRGRSGCKKFKDRRSSNLLMTNALDESISRGGNSSSFALGSGGFCDVNFTTVYGSRTPAGNCMSGHFTVSVAISLRGVRTEKAEKKGGRN